MGRFVVVALMSLILAGPAFGKNQREFFPVPCSELWPAVKDTLRNSGKYGIIKIDNTEMTASYTIGGLGSGEYLAERTNSVLLDSEGTSCEIQFQPAYSRLVRDFRKRVEESLAKLKASKPAESAKPEEAPK
jgi:hypothetical protein